MDTTQLQIVESKPSLKPMYSADDMISFHKDITVLITKALVKGQDYGTVPGISKPFLFKSGAERLCKAFGVVASYDILDKEVNHEVQNTIETKYGQKKTTGRFSYTVKCSLIGKSGAIAGDGIGLASTSEKKWASSPADNQNTVCKMAQKRALVAATLNAFGLSDRFTQDEETVTETNHDDKPNSNTVKRTQAKSAGYDKSNESHKTALTKALAEKFVSDTYWQEISDSMQGKSFTELDSVVQAITEKDIQEMLKNG